ncbi:tRNA uridine-5-carboxymethylaminomethyl(34) synthesis GTPase MnmE [Silicimonas algicola]|uniref:tRNA modification GTPase MnmE n=1 Tax=Silicimonas algicola TaxID=1826607 RepID=A0A316G940_9RHOB|nr:tRNA uridine-5-carboxymethylaminomethyl(34) synthesis GTPase MnmE [Silicimonas algicola]AZQ69448.1 tRNA uridine-5-carboxymethylaminomethyl(34) synthesis GTPase MnmE [Silicimonas algicola]PWK56516.1 tRNA modification GTPase trmE [Silicimonas algicola]
MDTIFALASARGRSGVAVVRLSGPQAFSALEQMAGRLPAPRRASLRTLLGAQGILDKALVLTFPEPDSFTGEDVVELHLHGSVAVVDAVLRDLGRRSGLRLAEAGEFTRRALENERLDLSQVEGLSDLIEAETEAQRKQAFRVFSGALGARAQSWRERLIRAAALLEATIDFADEDVPVDVIPEVTVLIESVQRELIEEASGLKAAERVREGFEIAIVGPPNVGKSTLLNTLAGREAAITSSIAGTTRDVIEVRMNLSGLPVTLVDTAGLREAQDEIEAMGVDRARRRADAADLRVILKASAEDAPAVQPRDEDVVVVSKSDLVPGDFSALTGAGINQLIERITSVLEGRSAGAGLIIRERQARAVVNAATSLGIARDRLMTSDGVDLTAEDLRYAIGSLDSLVGRVDVEHVLDEIFSSFCIGK